MDTREVAVRRQLEPLPLRPRAQQRQPRRQRSAPRTGYRAAAHQLEQTETGQVRVASKISWSEWEINLEK